MQGPNEKESFYIYDRRMVDFHKSLPSKENSDFIYNSPEVPDRILNIYKYLKEQKLLEKME